MSASILYNAINSSGTPSNAIGNPERVIESHVVQATFTGSPTAVKLTLQGSLDASSWFNLAEHQATAGEITAGALMYHVVYKPVIYVRLLLEEMTGGTGPTLTAKYVSTLNQVV